MSEEDAWDAEDFDPEAGFSKGGEGGEEETWEGEDEGLVIEDDKEEVKSKPVAAKKSKQDRIEEKKAKRREEELKNKPQEKEKEPAVLTEEEKLAQKRQNEDAQRASDLQSAMELFGDNPVSGSGGQLDRMNPKTPEEFEEFGQALSKKITQFEATPHYTAFLEGLFRSLCTPLDTENLRKLSTTIGAMATEKQKLKQPHAKKKKGKNVLSNVGKASRRADIDTYDDDLGADFDDFM